MVIILVKQEWLDEIGDLSKDLVIAPHSEQLRQVYAGKTEMEYPFVVADVARAAEGGKAFVPIHIPTEAIRGMFDLTDAEKQKLGFA